MLITSLLDTDLYKFTMMQCALHQAPSAQVEYRFVCRSQAPQLGQYIEQIKQELDDLCQLRFTKDELNYLGSLRYITSDFIDFLRLFQLNRDFVRLADDNGQLVLTIKGPWVHTILFEVPLLAIINEVYFNETIANPDYAEGNQRLQHKINTVLQHPDNDGFLFSEFGSRRRFSKTWHTHVTQTLASAVPQHLSGTSNVLLAKDLGLTPIGTMAHEFLQASQALGARLADSQKHALECWAQEYRGDLGIALTDVINIDAFLNDFDLYFAKLFDGLRQDSGDPFIWAEKVIAHYHALNIDPKTKTLVFSDALTIEKALSIYDRFKNQTKPVFGIGTHLTNDLGHRTLDIVIKMTHCNGQPVAKLSDAKGKTICDDDSYLSYLKNVFGVKS